MTETYEPTPEYSMYWLRRQDGQKPPPPFHDGFPQPGLYSIFGGGDPVRIIEVEGNVLVLVSEAVSDEPNQVWLKCGRNDVSFEAYNCRVGTGRWPGAAAQPTPGIGDNQPPDYPPEDLLPMEIEKAKEWLATVGFELKSDVDAHNAANRADAISKLRLKVEKVHEEEKAPHLTTCKVIDSRFLPKVKAGNVVIKALKDAIARYDFKKREELAKLKKVVELCADPGSASIVTPPLAAPVAYGNVGRKVSVKSKPLAKIIDQYAVYRAFQDEPEVTQLLQKLAQREVDNGRLVPGVEKVEGSVAR